MNFSFPKNRFVFLRKITLVLLVFLFLSGRAGLTQDDTNKGHPRIPAKLPFDTISNVLKAESLPSTTVQEEPPQSKHLVSYWSFDEIGLEAKDKIQSNHLIVKQAGIKFSWLHCDDHDGKNGSDMASLPHKEAKAGGLAFDWKDSFSFSAWVQGGKQGKWAGLNDIITMSRSGQDETSPFRDVKGWAFMIAHNRLRFGLIHAINYPEKDDRLTVVSDLEIPDDVKFHHVVVTYDGSGRSRGVTFYVDGKKNEKFAFDSETLGCSLTGSVAVEAPFNIGGRNDDHTDPFHFGFSGYIDDVSIFKKVLSEGEAIALYSLVKQGNLKFSAKQADQLFALYENQKGPIKVGERNWYPLEKGHIFGEPGQIYVRDGDFYLVLNADGSGVRTKKQ